VKILSVFNDYLERGGEAHAVDAIYESLSSVCAMTRCHFSSAEWTGAAAPNVVQQAAWMIRNPRSIEKLRERERQSGADAWLVHNVFPVGSAAIYSEARRLGRPIIQYIHNYRPFSVNGYLWAGDHLALGGLSLNYWEEIREGAWQNSRTKTAWFASVLWLTHLLRHWQSVKAWVAISDFARQTFIDAGVPAKDIFTLRHYWRPRLQVRQAEGLHYLYLGRLVYAKGILVLLDAWEILEQRLGSATPQLIIAGDGPLRSVVRARAEQMRSVTYEGHLSGGAKDAALRSCRALIVPSLVWETLGLVVYEAYDMSRPVLAARSGGLPESVIDGVSGRLHTAGDAGELANQIVEMERDSEARCAMGAAGRQWLEANTSESEWQRRFLEIATHALNA
jgi:glycosyltransferase involved in cell wall biosynthesis